MASQGFMVAWSWYLVALLVVAWVLWRGSRFLPLVWRTLITILPVLVALVPAPVSLLHESLAPAWIVALFDGLVQDEGSFWRAGKWVVLAASVSLLPVLLAARIQRKQPSEAEPQ
ncbi:MAG: hypothetical protein P1U78_07745 [Alcanivoracaceae bacterium]|nr:hypothetical protein [Alcanivoracaceae bacterium]